jgi:uncharacterized protein (DUF58 family)
MREATESRESVSRELLKKVLRIEIRTNRIVDDILAGEYHSVFKGQGMEFQEVREYTEGDDVRSIDWNVTARMGHPFIKRFVEERELTVMLLVDASSSGDFGTAEQMKGEIATELSALLAFSAIKNNDRVGLIIFTDQVELFVPPKKGKKHVLRLIRELLHYRPQKKRTNISEALEYLNRITRRKSVVFVISDFLDSDFEKPLRVANSKHDLVAISIADPRERELPSLGLIELEDSETGETVLLDTSSKSTRDGFSERSERERTELQQLFRRLAIDNIEVLTDSPYINPLIRFFKMRASRY